MSAKVGSPLRAPRVSMLALAAALAATGATAQEAGSGQTAREEATALQEIVVTARKREERLVDIPFSLQVVSGAELTKLGAVNFSDYARTVAGIQFEDKGAGRSNIFMRGVSTGGDVDTGKQSTVGVYFDETPISESSSQPDLKLYDIDHIEVLRGPQGTLFGSASLSGTLRILPKQPDTTKTEGFLQGQVSGTQRGGVNTVLSGMINVPISDKAALRVLAYNVQNEGFLTNGFTGKDNINDEASYGGRAALLIRPTDQLDITLTGIFQRSKFGAYYQATDHYPSLVIDQAEPEPFKDRYGIGTLKANYDFGPVKLTSVTSYFDRERYYQNDIDYFTAFLGVPQAFSPLTYTSKSFTQEVRLASQGDTRLSWVGGVFYEDRRESATQTISPAGEPVPAPADTVAFIGRKQEVRQLAAFGELNFKITPELIFTAGVRASKIDADQSSTNDGLLFGGKTTKTGTASDSPVNPRFILAYKPNDDMRIYVQASQGFRIGGVNPGVPPCLPANGCTVDLGATFGPDSVWNYELGTKLQLFERRLSVEAAVYFIKWTDIQVNVGRGDGFNGFLNAGSAETKGFELTANGQLSEHFRAGGQFTYTEGELTGLAPGVAATGVAQVGDSLPQIPKITSSAFLEWGTAFRDDGWFYVRGDVQYVDDRPGGFTSNLPRTLPNYTLVNLRAGVEFGPYSASIFVNNLTDKRAILADQNYSGLHDGQPYSWQRDNINIPRTVGVSLMRRF
jgi:iron complex outermembrane receptor protein